MTSSLHAYDVAHMDVSGKSALNFRVQVRTIIHHSFIFGIITIFLLPLCSMRMQLEAQIQMFLISLSGSQHQTT